MSSRWRSFARALGPRARVLGPWAAMVAGWVALFGPTIWQHMARGFQSRTMNDDVRIVLYYFASWSDEQLFPGDVLGRYHTDGTGDLYRALMFLLVQVWDVLLAGKLLSYALFFATLAGVGVAAHRLGGKSATFVSVALMLGAEVFMGRIFGGLPRAFAYPAVAWALAALAYGRVKTLAVLAVLGAGFYPVLPVILGLTLAFVLLVLPGSDQGSAAGWSLRRRIVVLALTVGGVAAVTVPFALRMRPYGDLITAGLVEEFPEAGPRGRVNSENRPPAPAFGTLLDRNAGATLSGSGEMLLPTVGRPLHRSGLLIHSLAVLTAFGVARLGLRRDGGGMRRVAGFAAASVLGFAIAEPVSPALVLGQRYVTYSVPALVALLVPVAAYGLVPRRSLARLRRPEVVASGLVLAYGLFVLAAFGTHGNDRVGINAGVKARDRALYKAVSRLPKDSLIAGWPRGMLDTLPIATERSALIAYETYMPYHTKMTLEMRARMRASLEAAFAVDVKPLQALREKFGVTHFVATKNFWKQGGVFRPLNRDFAHERKRYDARRADKFWQSLSRAVVYRDKRHLLVDLRRLPRR